MKEPLSCQNLWKSPPLNSVKTKCWSLTIHKMVHTSRSRYDLRDSVSFNRVTLHLPLKERETFHEERLSMLTWFTKRHYYSCTQFNLTFKNTWIIIMSFVFLLKALGENSHYLMCVAGRDSSCRERNNSRCRSWCFCFSGKSTISGFSISSSISPSYKETKLIIKNSVGTAPEPIRMSCFKIFVKQYTLLRLNLTSSETSYFRQVNN